MGAQEVVKIKVVIDSNSGKKGAQETKEYILDIKAASDRADESVKQLGTSSITMGNLMAQVWAKVAQNAKEVILWTKEMAFSGEETASKYETVVGPAIDRTNKFLEENAALMGFTTREGQDYVATSVKMAQGMKLTGDSAVDFGLKWISLAADMQSFYDEPIEEVFGAIRSMMANSYEPLERYGIQIREAEVKQRALVETGKTHIDQLNHQEIAQAKMILAYEKAGTAVGDLQRTRESGANTDRMAAASYREIAELLSQQLLPLWTDLARAGLNYSGVLKNLLNLNLSDQLQHERIELNALANQLIRATEAGEDRSDLIETLNDKYPDYLENLDQEKATVEELKEQLQELNQEYINKIALQLADEDQAAAAQKAGSASYLLAKLKIDADKELVKLNEQYKLGLDLTNGSLDENIQAVKQNLFAQAEFYESQTLGQLAANDAANAYSNLLGIQNDLTVATQKNAEAQEEAAAASEYRKSVEAAILGGDEVGAETNSDQENDPVVQPVEIKIIPPEEPIDKILEEKLYPVDIEVSPRYGEESMADYYAWLQEAEEQFTNATSNEERKRAQEKIEVLEREIQAKENGISYLQQLELEAHQERLRQANEYVQILGEAYGLVNDFRLQLLQNELTKVNEKRDAELDAIEEKLANDQLSERARSKLLQDREKAEEKYERKVTRLKRKQFELERFAKLINIGMNTAEAISKVWSQTGIFGTFAQVAPIAMGVLQGAFVASQPNPYLDGGLLQERLKTGLSTPGKKVFSINENNRPEYIMNADSTNRALPLLELMNNDPFFAQKLNSKAIDLLSPFKITDSASRVGFPKNNSAASASAKAALPVISKIPTAEKSSSDDDVARAVESAIKAGMQKAKLNSTISIVEIREADSNYQNKETAVGNQV